MLNSVISNFATGIFPIERRAVASYDDNGYYVAPALIIVNIELSIQPLSGLDLKMLPEGLHGEELVKIWAKEALYTQTDAHSGDEFVFNNQKWIIRQVKVWGGFKTFSGGSHWECIAAKKAVP